MSAERFGGIRVLLAAEAARLMYEEDVKEYFRAKRMAAKRVLGRVGGRRLRYRPKDLPSNGEIRDALLHLAELCEGDRRTQRLFAMRITALEAMKSLSDLHPRLIGSVSTGHIRRGSDIDIQVFCDDQEGVETLLSSLRWTFEGERTTIYKFGEIREYQHYHVADVFPIELTLYDKRELRFRPKSSTDGKPIVRMSVSALETLLMREHTRSWQRYLDDGQVDGLDTWLTEQDGPRPGPFDGLLTQTT
jgi:hypothetical protein